MRRDVTPPLSNVSCRPLGDQLGFGLLKAAIIGASTWLRSARLGRPVFLLTAIPAADVVPVGAQGAILNVTVLELPPVGVAIT